MPRRSQNPYEQDTLTFSALLRQFPYMRSAAFFFLSALFIAPIVFAQKDSDNKDHVPDLATPLEKHLRNVRQLTFGGQNAEAYFSSDGKKLIFQSTRDNLQCDQEFTMNIDGSDVRMVSNGKGRTTCGFWYPNGKTILYSSTYLDDEKCPPRPDFSKGYVWGIYPGY